MTEITIFRRSSEIDRYKYFLSLLLYSNEVCQCGVTTIVPQAYIIQKFGGVSSTKSTHNKNFAIDMFFDTCDDDDDDDGRKGHVCAPPKFNSSRLLRWRKRVHTHAMTMELH